MTKNKNPFADLFGSFSNGLPNFPDLDQLVSSVKQATKDNTKAFSDAAKILTANTEAYYRHQTKAAEKANKEAAEFVQDVTSTKTPEDANKKAAEFAARSLESASATARELSELAAKSHEEAGKIITKRASEVISELTQAANANSSKKKASAA